ncbi:MAG: hypothetical protein HMLIMOIP_000055 [Candidatus Nitrosomirales archaeon]|jgi:hypothetical protein
MIATLLITSVYVFSSAPAYAPGSPPVANAGPDQTVDEDALVVLDGSGSSDPEGDPLTFSWTQTAGPTVTLANANTVNPTFTAPLVSTQTVLTFQLVVNDGTQNSTPDTVNITVNSVLNVITGRFDKITTVGSQTITVGFQPKALILFTNGHQSGGLQEGYNFAIGFSNGTSSRSNGMQSDDNAATSNTGRGFGGKVLRILSSGNPTVISEADASFTSTGFTLTWTKNDPGNVASKIHYIALGGPIFTNVKVDQFIANSVTGPQTVSTVGFQPDFLMFINPRTNSDGTSQNVNAFTSFGFAVSATERAAIAVTSNDNRATMNTCRSQRTDLAILTLMPGSCNNVDSQADFVSMDSTGFTINWTDAPDPTNIDRIYYLALKGGRHHVGSLTQPISGMTPVPQPITGVGFLPEGLILTSFNSQANSAVLDHNRLSFGAAHAPGDGNEGVVWVGDTDNVATSITARTSITTKIMRLMTENEPASFSTINAAADLQSFDADGFTLSWSNIDGTPREIIYVAFDPPSGSPPSWMEDKEVTQFQSQLSQIEPYIAVKSASEPDTLVAAYMDEVYTATMKCATARSTNGGTSWPSNDYRAPAPPSWVNLNSSTDPVIVSDTTGKFYMMCIGFATTGDGIWQATSTDGINWTSGNVSRPVDTSGNVDMDKEWVAVDKNTSSPFKDRVYVCWTEIDRTVTPEVWRIKFFRPGIDSTPQIRATVSGGPPNSFVQGCYIAVGPVQNEVYLAWVHYNTATTADIKLTRNDNGGSDGVGDWKAPRTVSTITRLNCGQFSVGDVSGTGTSCIRAAQFPTMAIDFRSTTGIHITYSHKNGVTNKADIFYRNSYNCGKNTDFNLCTFNPASGVGLQLNSVGAGDQWEPAIMVRKTALNPEGNVHVTARDRRSDTSNVNWEIWHYHCHTNQFSGCQGTGDWHGPNNQKKVSDTSSNNHDNQQVGEYHGIASSTNTEVHAVFIHIRSDPTDFDIFYDKTINS